MSFTCFTEGTCPLRTTFSSITRTGVCITLYSIILTISSTFSMVASIPVSATASRVTFSSVLHLGHPGPRIFISIIFYLLMYKLVRLVKITLKQSNLLIQRKFQLAYFHQENIQEAS